MHVSAECIVEGESRQQDRRAFLTRALPAVTATVLTSAVWSRPAVAEEETSGVSRKKPPKILVLGGTGFVGSTVVQTLKDMGIETVATSRDGRNGTQSLYFAAEITVEEQLKRIQSLAQGCTAVISCVGAIGTPSDRVVNSGTAIAAQAAKKADVSRFVYITVAPEVQEFAKDIDFLNDYMAGMAMSRQAVLDYFPNSSTLIEPTFIYGGGSFQLNPPRVASFYGQFIEGILSSFPIRSVERVMSPGIMKIALKPPVPVQDVAQAAIVGAIGIPVLDSYDKIKQASRLLHAAAE